MGSKIFRLAAITRATWPRREGMRALKDAEVAGFAALCRDMRYWKREAKLMG